MNEGSPPHSPVSAHQETRTGNTYAMAAAASYAMAVNIDSRDDETAISCDWAAAFSGAVAALGFCRSSQPAEFLKPRLHRLGFFCGWIQEPAQHTTQ